MDSACSMCEMDWLVKRTVVWSGARSAAAKGRLPWDAPRVWMLSAEERPWVSWEGVSGVRGGKVVDVGEFIARV